MFYTKYNILIVFYLYFCFAMKSNGVLVFLTPEIFFYFTDLWTFPLFCNYRGQYLPDYSTTDIAGIFQNSNIYFRHEYTYNYESTGLLKFTV